MNRNQEHYLVMYQDLQQIIEYQHSNHKQHLEVQD